MIPVIDLISLQGEKEKAAFIQFLESRNKRKDTRNVSLYKDFLNGNEKRLLNEISANSYNALKKRLSDQLIDFSAASILSKELSAEGKVIKLIALSRNLLTSGKLHTGYMLLKRAEKIAVELEHHSILNEIYHSMIEHAHKSTNVDLETLFKKLEQNNEQFIAQERLSVLYASMLHQFNTENLSDVSVSLHNIYDEGLKTFGIKPEMALNFKSLNQLCILSDLYAAQTKNYKGLDLFFEELIPTIQGGVKDNEKALVHHIELLYGLANIYFRKNNLEQSKYYLDQMYIQMKRYDSRCYGDWIAPYTNVLALIYNFTGSWEKALNVLSDCFDTNQLSQSETLLLKLNLCVIHFQQGNLEKVKTIMRSFKKTDAWFLKEMGNEWLFNYKAMEVLLHFDLENDQLAESLIESFKRKYTIHFKKDKDNAIWPFLLLVKSILLNPEQLNSEKFEKKVEATIPWKGESEDFFNLCFYAWLKAKMNGRPVYETTMSLLKTT